MKVLLKNGIRIFREEILWNTKDTKKTEEITGKTGLSEAVVTGKAKIDGREAVIGVCDGRS